jgi:hypothetical protein
MKLSILSLASTKYYPIYLLLFKIYYQNILQVNKKLLGFMKELAKQKKGYLGGLFDIFEKT